VPAPVGPGQLGLRPAARHHHHYQAGQQGHTDTHTAAAH